MSFLQLPHLQKEKKKTKLKKPLYQNLPKLNYFVITLYQDLLKQNYFDIPYQ